MQGEAVIRRLMPRERGQMCARMTCRPDELPAVNQEAPFSSTSFFQIEPTPVPTSQLHAGEHTQRRESSGGNFQHISAINCHDANTKTEPEETVNHTKHTNFLCHLSYPADTHHSSVTHKPPQSRGKAQDCTTKLPRLSLGQLRTMGKSSNRKRRGWLRKCWNARGCRSGKTQGSKFCLLPFAIAGQTRGAWEQLVLWCGTSRSCTNAAVRLTF